jgi:hypothetical protein
MRVPVAVVVILVAVFIGTAPAQSDGQQPAAYLYQWVDDQGAVHITDDLGSVPEKYRSSATRMKDTSPPQEPSAGRPQAEPVPPRNGSGAQQNDKAQWQQRMRDAKNQLADAEARYRSLQQKRADLFAAWGSPAEAPLANRQQADQIDQQMQEVQQEIEKAKNMINNVIPEEARKAGVPPGWLRE